MRALVLGGGGSHGAWQVGCIKHLIEDLGIQYDMFCGVSVGAINVSWLAQYEKSNQKSGFQALHDLWYNMTDSTVKKNWLPFFEITGLWKDSIFNSTPLINLIHKSISLDKIRASGNSVAVSATRMSDGKYVTFTQDDPNFIDGILASSSFPMGLNPIIIDGYKYSDGGIKHTVPINEAVKLGATDLDIIICGPKHTTGTFNDVDVVTYGLRCFDYMSDQMVISDIKLANLYNKLVSANLQPDKKFLNIKIIQPQTDFTNSSLSFDNATMRSLLEQGYEDAKTLYK